MNIWRHWQAPGGEAACVVKKLSVAWKCVAPPERSRRALVCSSTISTHSFLAVSDFGLYSVCFFGCSAWMCGYIYVLNTKNYSLEHTVPISLVPVVVESTLLAVAKHYRSNRLFLFAPFGSLITFLLVRRLLSVFGILVLCHFRFWIQVNLHKLSIRRSSTFSILLWTWLSTSEVKEHFAIRDYDWKKKLAHRVIRRRHRGLKIKTTRRSKWRKIILQS